MKIERKLQIDVIKGERIYYAEYGELTLITDGHVGVYLTASELKVDKAKMIEVANDTAALAPVHLEAANVKARETNTAYRMQYGNCFAIKLKAVEGDNECYVKDKFLKMFDGYNGLFIQGKKDAVLVTKYGKPYGVIMPVNIAKELE
ncbi:MAG: hypothetical protein ABS949_14885 [Solibacillus sp.]